MSDRTVFTLASLAGCASPDSSESAGADFLTSVEDAVLEVVGEAGGFSRQEDAVVEIADNAPDAYTYKLWQEFVDLGAWQEDPSELAADASDMEQCARVCLYMIAERLASALFEEEHAEQEERAREIGLERGVGAGSWVLDGNSSTETARKILEGIEEGDPEVMEIAPAPLSGEWAGQSVPELSSEFGLDLEDDEIAQAFEDAFSEGFWQEVERSARYMLEDVDTEA